ncbi:MULTISPECIES: hypothetical protein [unclassified Rhizobium]|uniref:hypothetical protein n=1 Tax=unclassified Rhizobium TaxID=2613769 RepID=UPI0016188FE8|nr:MULTISPECIES: hypothetical protein [unclassified Rhizobium]MBB3287071.1 hypothetical protein [Rhizobium sp. BK252]MBB3401811.1 hypothetical protein [Rhizobium sp. BK289]MBB3414245.1 hypothetical protein [Rhizobium sp. BK284]MBB3482132.1 hypothetical protein [Rhizobium sp. BK347]
MFLRIRTGILTLLLLLSVQVQAQDLPIAANTAALQAFPSTMASAVLRLDAASGVGAPPQFFTSSPSACSITGGDVGSQVPPSDGKCWIAQYGAAGADLRQWGCVGNGTADNSACVQKAINAMQGGLLRISGGLFRVNSALTSAGQIVIEGDAGGGGIYNAGCSTGLRAGPANFDLLTLRGAGSVLSRVCIDSVNGATSTSGAAVVLPVDANSVRLEGNQINGICWAIDVSGIGSRQNVESIITQNTITILSDSPLCGGIRVGVSSTKANTVDLKLTNNAVYCNYKPGTGLLVLDAGGIVSEGNVFSFNCGVGTKIFPGAEHAVAWSSFAGSVLGDTDTASGLVIDTGSSTATVFGNRFTGSWASNSNSDAAILIQNTANALSFSGIYFVQQTVYARSNLPAIRIKGGRNIHIRDSTICSAGPSSSSGIIYEGNASNIMIQNNRIGQCDNYNGGTVAAGITISTSSTDIGMVTGNDFTFTVTPINWSPTANSNNIRFIANDNFGIDDTFSSPIPTASAISVPVNPIAIVSGNGTISSITPVYQGRRIKMIVQGIVNFTTGGNICTARTTSFNQTVEGIYNPSYNCWFLQ